MHIFEMKLAGRITKGKIPRHFATIHRTSGNAYITVTLITAASQREHLVEADNPEDVFSVAQCLQYHLDGHKGTGSMVHDYYRILQNFTD